MFELLKTIWQIIFGKKEEPPSVLEPETPADIAPEPEKGFEGEAPWTVMDVSKWQGEINWQSVKNSGKVHGVMLRIIGEGAYIDPRFEENYALCKKLGIPVGGYIFSIATTKEMADKERALFAKAVKGKTFELPIALDVESQKFEVLSKGELTDLVAYSLKEIENLGFYAMLYTYLSFAANNLYMSGAALSPYDVWLAAYRKQKPGTDYAYSMWQYTSKASIPGVNGEVDLSTTDRDYVKIIAKKGLDRLKEGA